jgi:3-oxoisoapionate decarboxylase
MALRIGLNPYGLAYAVGLQGAGTPRANPSPIGLDGFLAVAREAGARCVEIHGPWLDAQSPASLERIRRECEALGATPIISTGLDWAVHEGQAVHEPSLHSAITHARAMGATLIRLGLTPVLEGSRAAWGDRWPALVARARETLAREAPRAADAGMTIAIEDHQDFGSEELVEMAEAAGPNVGITFDTGNPFVFGEDPVAFARRAAHRIRHVHLKDYRAQFTTEGYRLVRCAIGEGAVPFAELVGALDRDLTASLEPGALEARHIRLFTEDWWRGYPPVDARRLAAALRAAQVNRLREDEDFRTPWERGVTGDELTRYELDMMRSSAANLRALGLME